MTPAPAEATREDLLRFQSEAVFQSHVTTFAKQLGWMVYHTHNSQRSEAGFPDLVMVRDERVVVAELKKVTGKVTPDQQKWLDAFRRIEHLRESVFVWRPTDWPEIEATLGPSAGPGAASPVEARGTEQAAEADYDQPTPGAHPGGSRAAPGDEGEGNG